MSRSPLPPQVSSPARSPTPIGPRDNRRTESPSPGPFQSATPGTSPRRLARHPASSECPSASTLDHVPDGYEPAGSGALYPGEIQPQILRLAPRGVRGLRSLVPVAPCDVSGLLCRLIDRSVGLGNGLPCSLPSSLPCCAGRLLRRPSGRARHVLDGDEPVRARAF